MTADGQHEGIYAPREASRGRSVRTRLGTLTVYGGVSLRRRRLPRAAVVALALAAVVALALGGAALYGRGWSDGVAAGRR